VIGTVIALLAPYAMFVMAEVAHTSGVTAVVIGGLYRSGRRGGTSRSASLLRIEQVYGVVVFLLESTVFAIIGLELPSLVRALPSSEHGFVLAALAVTGALLLTRVVWVSGATLLPGLFGPSDERALTSRRSRVVAVASWAGTRGVVPLAAALSVPVKTDAGLPFPHRDLLLVLATVCTAATLVVQGMTLRPLVHRTGIARHPE
jgi:monovalent cation/hydrogen antiporter